MKLRAKAVTIVGAITVVIFVACYVEAFTMFLPSFSRLETQATEKRLVQTVVVIKNELSDLDSKTSDWAFWDDTYDFAKGNNSEYIKLNLLDSTFVNLRLNFIVILDSTGQLVYAKAYDYENTAEVQELPDVCSSILSNSAFWRFSQSDAKMSGFVLGSNGAAIVSAKPILSSLEQGPIAGTLIMGRFFDSAETSFVSTAVNLPVTFVRFDEPQIPKDFQTATSSLSATNPLFVMPINESSIGGYALLSDVFSNPALVLKISDSREVYAAGLGLAYSYVAISFLLCVAFGASIILLIEKGILRPIRKLTSNVKSVAFNGGADSILVSGKDETSLLAEAVKDTIAQRLSAIEELAGMVGHDLRNPLQGISSASYYLRKKCDPEMTDKGRDMLKVIDSSVAYSNKIVNDLLEYSRNILLERTETTPKGLIDNLMSSAKIPDNVQLVFGTCTEPKINVDMDKLKRALLNIVTNSVDAMPNGGTLTITSERRKDAACIVFEDTGIGMSKETLDKIGTPLFTTKAKGMGFGFSISKRFVEAHGGSITAKSSENKGTTITVTLPLN